MLMCTLGIMNKLPDRLNQRVLTQSPTVLLSGSWNCRNTQLQDHLFTFNGMSAKKETKLWFAMKKRALVLPVMQKAREGKDL